MPNGTLQLHPDEHIGGDRQRPGGHHEQTVPGEPLVLAAALAAHPCLLEVAGEDNSQRGGTDPGGNHEGPVELNQQFAGSLQILNFRQIDGLSRGQAADVVVANTVLL